MCPNTPHPSMPKSQNASLLQIRSSIQARSVIQFEYGGERWKVEPHDLVQSPHHSLVLQAWVLEGRFTQKWLVFLFAEIRGCQLLAASFGERELPSVLFQWRGPGDELRPVSKGLYRHRAPRPTKTEG